MAIDPIEARNASYGNRVSRGEVRTLLEDVFTLNGTMRAGEQVTCEDDSNAGFNGIVVYVKTADGRANTVSTGQLSRA